MMHRKRRWVISAVPTMEKLAEMLTQTTWTLCSGFYVEGHPYLFLNDATHEDGKNPGPVRMASNRVHHIFVVR